MNFSNLQLRFMLMVIAGAMTFALGAGILAYRAAHSQALEAGRVTLDGLVVAVEKTLAIGAYAGDSVLLKEVTDGLARHPLVRRVEVRNPARVVLAQTGETGTGGIGDIGEAAVHVKLDIVSPFDRSETLAFLEIEANAERLEAIARQEARGLALAMAGQTALVALLLYSVAARLVSRPIARLAVALGKMKPGTSDRLHVPKGHARDEIGMLVGSANDLLQANGQALQRERELRAEIEQMEAQYRQIFDSSSAGIFVLDREGRLINGNPTAFKVTGLDRQTVSHLHGMEFINRVFGRPEKVWQMIAEAQASGETISADLQLLQSDHSSRWVHCLISVQGDLPDPATPLIEGVMYDITERKRIEAAVLHQAEHDGLTGLKSRTGTTTSIDRLLSQVGLSGGGLSLLYIDLDGFKQVNDTLGHKAGDQVLVQCAKRMRQVVRRATDLVGRLGGDEFVIVLTDVGASDMVLGEIAANLVTLLEQPIVLEDGQVARIGASVGIACSPVHGATQKQLLNAADTAMYEVKRSGKNTFALAMHVAA